VFVWVDREHCVTFRAAPDKPALVRSTDQRASVSTDLDTAEALAVECRRLLTLARVRQAKVRAKDILREAAANLSRITGDEDPSPTLSEYIPIWVEHNRTAWKKSTRQDYESRVRNYVLPAFGDLPVNQISRRLTRRWAESLAQTLSHKSVVNMLRVLSSILSSAVDDEILQSNPALRMGRIMPKARQDKRRATAWSPEQMRRILDAGDNLAPTPDLAMLLHVLEAVGLRIGEACGLQWPDFDPETGKLDVRRGVVRGEVTSTKSRQERNVWVPLDLVPRLDALRTQQKRRALRKKTQVAPWMFQTTDCTALSSDTVRNRFLARVLEASRVPHEGAKFHQFRHSRASWWLMAGVPIFLVSRWLGHSSIQTTADTYGHVIEELEQRVLRGDGYLADPFHPSASYTPQGQVHAPHTHPGDSRRN